MKIVGEEAQEVYALIKSTPGISTDEIASLMFRAPSTIGDHILFLKEQGLVAGKTRRYEILRELTAEDTNYPTETCRVCGKQFPKTTSVNIYCSKSCKSRRKNNRYRAKGEITVYKRTCVNPLCGIEFETFYHNQLHCDSECSKKHKASLKKNVGWVRKPAKTVKCAYCGNDFVPTHSKQQYCSIPHYLLANNLLATPDSDRTITHLTLLVIAVAVSRRGQTTWEAAQDMGWYDKEVFEAKFEPFKEYYEKLLTDYKKRAIS